MASHACYRKLFGSLSNMVEFLTFTNSAIQFLQQESGRIEVPNLWKENLNKLNNDLKIFKEIVGSSIKCFQEVSLVKSLEFLDKEMERKEICLDLEMGKSPKIPSSDEKEVMIERTLNSYLQHCNEFLEAICAEKGDQKELKNKTALSLSCVGFCISNIASETVEIEKAIKELVQWENPSSHVNLHEIASKIRALTSAAEEDANSCRS